MNLDCDVRFEPWSDQIQLHHADVAAFAELQIRYLEHWRSFACAWAATGQLYENLLGTRIQGNGRNLKRRRKLDRVNLARDCHAEQRPWPCCDGVSWTDVASKFGTSCDPSTINEGEPAAVGFCCRDGVIRILPKAPPVG